MDYMVVTPYFKESEKLIRRCIESVRAQSVPCDHVLVADGFPQDWLDNENIRHLKLDKSHNDFGNTPRGLGALLAASENYKAICFLDADNWFDPEHVETCLRAAQNAPGGLEQCDYVVASRTFRRPDETILPIADVTGHVDTNCFVLLPGSFAYLAHWVLIPNDAASAGDRLFGRLLAEKNLTSVRTSKPTVNYETIWKIHYSMAGEPAPDNAKDNLILPDGNGKTPRDTQIRNRLVGFDFYRLQSKRNDLCSCGSGLRFKKCHGAYV